MLPTIFQTEADMVSSNTLMLNQEDFPKFCVYYRDGWYQNFMSQYIMRIIMTIIDIIMISFKLTVTVLYIAPVVKILCNNFIDAANRISWHVNLTILTIILRPWYYNTEILFQYRLLWYTIWFHNNIIILSNSSTPPPLQVEHFVNNIDWIIK